MELENNNQVNDNSQKTLLLVEDDKFLSDLFGKKIEKHGFNLIKAEDGNSAIELITKNIPDLVLLDIILPGIDGFEVIKRIKTNPETKNIPVVFLSNLGQEEDIKKGRSLGAVDFLIKATLTPEKIIRRVEEILARKS